LFDNKHATEMISLPLKYSIIFFAFDPVPEANNAIFFIHKHFNNNQLNTKFNYKKRVKSGVFPN
jgi:hypothetical protein